MRVLAAFLVAVAGAGVCGAQSLFDHRELTLSERAGVAGGEPTKKKECADPIEGTACAKDNVPCAIDLDLELVCENLDEGAHCGVHEEYFSPKRCRGKLDPNSHCDDKNEDEPNVPCFNSYNCTCELFLGVGPLICMAPLEATEEFPVRKCKGDGADD